jgi:hypothetical protein
MGLLEYGETFKGYARYVRGEWLAPLYRFKEALSLDDMGRQQQIFTGGGLGMPSRNANF